MDPADIHATDQWHARFADLKIRLTELIVTTDPESLSLPRFEATLAELGDEPVVMTGFVSYLLALLAHRENRLDQLAEALASIQTVTVNNMSNVKVRSKLIAALDEFRDEAEQYDMLFSGEALEQAQPSESYTTGTGQVLHNIHGAGSCIGFCVIHSPISGPWDKWPTHWREDRGIMERLCPHRIGHPALEDVLRHGDGIHGCDGCECGPRLIEEKLQKALEKEFGEENSTDS